MKKILLVEGNLREANQEFTDNGIKTHTESLKESIAVCHGVDSCSDNVENSYPYATGYSRSCMTSIVETLELIKN